MPTTNDVSAVLFALLHAASAAESEVDGQLAAVGLSLLVRAAMAPLGRLSAVAESITSGHRGRRMDPDRPDTELGRAATSFDAMLDALEHSEQRARRAASTWRRAPRPSAWRMAPR